MPPDPNLLRANSGSCPDCRRLLNIINVAAEYLRDPERDLAEGRALAALALDKAGEASDD